QMLLMIDCRMENGTTSSAFQPLLLLPVSPHPSHLFMMGILLMSSQFTRSAAYLLESSACHYLRLSQYESLAVLVSSWVLCGESPSALPSRLLLFNA
ncbi:hypothetical protein PENTCL1PPCAC_27627, partial [Pristionchus entomophagus]